MQWGRCEAALATAGGGKMADELDQLLDEVERRFCRMPDRGATGGGQNGDRERAAAEGR